MLLVICAGLTGIASGNCTQILTWAILEVFCHSAVTKSLTYANFSFGLEGLHKPFEVG